MTTEKKYSLGIVLVATLLLFSFSVSAVFSVSNPQFTSPGANSFGYLGRQNIGFPQFNEKMCNTGNDFIVQIAPFGCTPAVVRSDLLEEQNVPVFCQLYATKINPLIDVNAIDYLSFQGKYPEGISGIGFHPARAAVRSSQTLLNSPILENIGYVVIVLKQNPDESKMPDFISGNLTADIRYDIENAFGIGQATYYLPELNNNDWENQFQQYGFWSGKAFLRAQGLDKDSASVSVYLDKNNKLSTFTLSKGQTSGDISLPGFYCQAGLKLRLDELKNPDTRAKLSINGEIAQVGEREKFLDNSCSITDLQKEGINQEAEIVCSTDEGGKKFQLKISPKLSLNITDKNSATETKELSLGDRLYNSEDGKETVYLGYIGTKENSNNVNDLFAYFVKIPVDKEKLSKEELTSISNSVNLLISKKITGSKVTDSTLNLLKKTAGFANKQIEFLRGKEFYKIEYSNQKEITIVGIKVDQTKIEGKSVRIINFAAPVDKEIKDNLLKDNFEKALKDYNAILQSFPNEKEISSDKQTFGQKALIQAISLASKTEQKKTLMNLCNDFEQRYPLYKSDVSGYCGDKYRISSAETSSYGVVINGKTKIISFEGIYEPALDEYSAEIIVTYPDKTKLKFEMKKNEVIYLNETAGETMQLISLEDEFAQIKMNLLPSGTVEKITNAVKVDTKTLKKDVTENLGGNYLFTLTKINLKKVAKVSVLPNIQNTGTKANFSFNIGIEKRGIQLSPEEIKDKIENLDDSIEGWEDVSGKLGTVVKGFNAACLGVGTTLTIKNLFENFGGKSIARQQVMRSSGGWTETCKNAVSRGEYSSIDSCFIENSDKIEGDVEKVYSVMQKQEKITNENVNQKLPEIGKLIKGTAGNPDNSKEKIDVIEGSDVYSAFSKQGYDDRKISLTQARDIERLQTILDSNPSPELETATKRQLYQILSNVKANSENFAVYSSLNSDLSKLGIGVGVYGAENTIKADYKGGKIPGSKISGGTGFNPDETYLTEVVVHKNIPYAIFLNNIGGNKYAINEKNGVYKYDKIENGNLVVSPIDSASQKEANEVRSNFIFTGYDKTSYQNKFLDPEVKYFETEPYKGLPAIVPFDLQKGWYVGAKQTLPGFGNIRAYDESGKATSFYICNVGKNGRQELNSNIGDDICRNFNPGIEQVQGKFPGLSESDTTQLARNAVQAVQDASRQYKAGLKGKIKILNELVPVGSPEVGVPDIQCQDFMSPKECLLLFNSCDPVVCPASRCDLGGTYHVDDVIQSGIIGSAALCLPNAKENIAVPVCLSGVKAGVDGLISVQKSYRNCLQENLNTGKTVGICDEIHSIYLCDFFWSQTLPMSKILVPKALEFATGQTGRGGGEYLGVAEAWKNAENSVDYMTNYYGASSFEAFKTGIVKEVGHAICKNFISVSYPDNADLLGSLLEPKSPPQYTAWFSEKSFTTATVPPVSQYKVFYHIFAGKNEGAYYSVYLKSPEGSSYFQSNPTLTVDSGYINKGESASQTKDFTAPSNYKELCIMVNAKENCGFKQVSSDFALNYANDKFIQEQASQTNIKTESECVSGTSSAYSFINPNLQAGLQDFINPDLYNKQVVRICSTNNPGEGTDINAGTQNSRWLEVGTCDNGIGKLKCYLDRNSVKEIIKSTTIENETISSVQNNVVEKMLKEGGYIQNFEKLLNELNKLTATEKTLNINKGLIDRAFLNNQKARLLLLRGDAFAELAVKKFSGLLTGSSSEDSGKKAAIPDKTGQKIPFSYEVTGVPGRLGVYFRYDNDWRWSADKINWESVKDRANMLQGYDVLFQEEVINLALNLESKTYEQGLERLTTFVLIKTGRAIVTDNVIYSRENFEFDGGRGIKIFVKGEAGKWSVAYLETNGEKKWISVKDIQNNPHKDLITQTNKELLESLEGKTIEQGAAIIFGKKETVQTAGINNANDALKEINSIISELGNNVKYSNSKLKILVDDIHSKKILTSGEFNEINGGGTFDLNLEENAGYVKELLEIKTTSWIVDSAVKKLEESKNLVSGNYLENVMFAAFVEKLYSDKILSDKEHDYMKEVEFSGEPRNRNALLDLLRKKKTSG